jgi:phosphatidylinositol alpha 1,6-mannosyltransferase
MKILISAESFLPRSNGVTNSVTRAMRYLTDAGHTVVVVAPGDGPEYVEGQRVIRIPAISLKSRATVDVAAVSVRRILKVLDEVKPDVVHLASPFFLGEQVRKAARIRQIPIVAVYQTDISGFASFYGLSLIKSLGENRIRKIHSGVDLNLVPSKTSERYLNSLGVTNCSIWGRGVDTSIFNPWQRSHELRKSWGASKKTFVFGYVGRLAPEKQIERLTYLQDIGILAGIDAKMLVIGDGPSKQHLKEKLPSALFTGNLIGQQLGKAMASLDLLVTTGEHETFCQVVQEGMASGIPVVSPRIGGPIELIEENRTGMLYEPGNGFDLRRKVLNLMSNNEVSRQMGDLGFKKVSENTWENVCAQLESHYESLLNLKENTQAS